jgi:hypothetical protein
MGDGDSPIVPITAMDKLCEDVATPGRAQLRMFFESACYEACYVVCKGEEV